jgi:glyceraldehyde 3-phosphate dehydrogenase
MRVGINGMGRIGRLLFKLLQETGHEVVAVNDVMSKANLIYLLKYDSIYGNFRKSGELIETDDGFQIGNTSIRVFNETMPANIPWSQVSPEVVVECTGRFLNNEALKGHLSGGAQSVLLSTTGSGELDVIIRGFNDREVPPGSIVAAGGCMTNCTIPIVYHLNKYAGIESAHLNVIHSYTTRQLLSDGPASDFRRGRAAASSIIPVENDLHHVLMRVFPELNGKVLSSSTRVPVDCGALADMHFLLKKSVSAEEVNELFNDIASTQLKGLMSISKDPIVSRDIIRNSHSSVIDATLTKSLGNHLKLCAWFDDQFAFTCRLIELIGLFKF